MRSRWENRAEEKRIALHRPAEDASRSLGNSWPASERRTGRGATVHRHHHLILFVAGIKYSV
jgi:hypothetical protein